MKAVALLSSGIDSPVAIYLMLKKGLEVIPIHFKQDESKYRKVQKIWKRLRELYPKRLKELVVVDVYEYQAPVFEKLIELKKHKWICVFCKFTMYKKATEIAKENGAWAIITGDSLGQVASQTLDNLVIISLATDLPILRPLIGFDKEEVVKIAKEIGTFDISIEPEEGCPFVPKHPIIRGSLGEFKKVHEAVFGTPC
ncbi:7-cyano-7-deazaguanine synthase [Thermococcus paralvinellae]|uniref:Thiamine biosynthesis ThiI-like protein n=1 Tax=Thermococcus paralvinellae TaxID=582419 RepID=W0I821_9EURY|nr:7-cyano-7-deazaguanine synthase [Thermococcus paralvinellae]AHF80605.1 thiamine biosynthesis ThiI-like protein [Thermococcus paralvinellae]